MKKHNLVFVDIECTGLDVIKHEIIELGCVLTTPELVVIEQFEFKIKPERIEDADPIALKINHYEASKWDNAISLKEAMKIFAAKVKDHIMVGQNVAFDASYLEHAFSKMGIPNGLHHHKLDTVSIAWAKLYKDADFEHFSLHELCERFGIKNEKEHTALSDARATYELYKKLMSL